MFLLNKRDIYYIIVMMMVIGLLNLIISPVLTMNCKLLVLEPEVNVIPMYIAHLIL